ncbi:DsbA family oxidoreductase [Enterovibrio calviensis]|uniref:DsbA family oxidoreductase n=1 Tax=Enterovibrio calviensis TaxID=91359 RepID=UPI000480288F|nr:DsbA family oxidoreductase [Enterovibrio calviensis]
MSNRIKIDIVSDVVCPWCIVGYKRLEKAINELGLQDSIDIEWQPFQLNPYVGKDGENLFNHIMKKYGNTREDNVRMRENLTGFGEELGFAFQFFDEMKTYNTQDVHQLLDYAKTQNRQHDLAMRLFSAYFTEKQDISNREVLAAQLKAVGLDVSEGLAQLDDSSVRERVEKNQSYWRELGVSSVPTIVFNRESAVSGAQPVEVLTQILSELHAGR